MSLDKEEQQLSETVLQSSELDAIFAEETDEDEQGLGEGEGSEGAAADAGDEAGASGAEMDEVLAALVETLNEQQRDIVLAPPQDMMVIAGAGTGKTHVMISRIAYLLKLELAKPWNILAMTFTNKAAREMSDRVCKYMGWLDPHHMILSTFHSFCFRMLKQYALQAMLPQNFVLLDPSDQANMLQNFLKERGIESSKRRTEGSINVYDIINYISKKKDAGESPSISEAEAGFYVSNLSPENNPELFGRDKTPLFEVIYGCYLQLCARAGAVDFDDLIIRMVRLLQQNDELRTSLQNRFTYIFVDEFQDTNRMQYELLMQLKGEHNFISVVGDDDQCIYEWRGANIKNIERLPQDLPELNMYSLTINYRSTQHILNFSNALIQANKQRLLQKSLVTPKMFDAVKLCEVYLLQHFAALLRENSGPWELKSKQYKELTGKVAADANLSPYFGGEEVDFASLGAKERSFLSSYILDFYHSFLPSDFVTLMQRSKWEEVRPESAEQPEYERLYKDDDSEPAIWPEALRQDLLSEFSTWPKVQILSVNSDGAAVSTIISVLQHHNVPLEEIAVLYRNNALSAGIEKNFTLKGIPHQVYGGLRFYDRVEIQGIISYLRLIANPLDDAAFQRVINLPRRGIGTASVQNLASFAGSVGLSLYNAVAHIYHSEDGASRRRFKKFLGFYEEIENYKALLAMPGFELAEFVNIVLYRSGLWAYFLEQDRGEKSALQGTSREDNLKQLLSEISELESSPRSDAFTENDPFDLVDFNNPEAVAAAEDAFAAAQAGSAVTVRDLPPLERLNYFLGKAKLQSGTEMVASGSTHGSGVQMMTIHASKGLEFTAVIVVGCEDGILPSSKSLNIEEERRLAYVAFTRAKRYLFTCSTSYRQGYMGLMPSYPSEFFDDIKNFYNFNLGLVSKDAVPYSLRRSKT